MVEVATTVEVEPRATLGSQVNVGSVATPPVSVWMTTDVLPDSRPELVPTVNSTGAPTMGFPDALRIRTRTGTVTAPVFNQPIHVLSPDSFSNTAGASVTATENT